MSDELRHSEKRPDNVGKKDSFAVPMEPWYDPGDVKEVEVNWK